MKIRRAMAAAANAALKPTGIEIVSKERLERYRRIEQKFVPVWGPSYADSRLPDIAVEYLRADNARLLELRRRYNAFESPASRHSFWKPEYSAGIPLQYFRGDNPYVWQFQEDNSEVAHLLTAYFLQTQDRLELLKRIKEDGLFGAYTFSFNDEMLISRDLLDSVCEITFLDREFGISKLEAPNLLDIGAGYGRLAYRLADALPNIGKVFTTDSVPESTFLSEFYIRFRNVEDKVQVIPLDEMAALRNEPGITFALNIHSFSECTLESICWWLDQLAERRVKYLIVVPNNRGDGGRSLVSTEIGKPGVDFGPAIADRSYKRVLMTPKYLAPSVQRHGISPTHYHAFEFQG